MLNADEEIGSPIRKIIRVESEETQDYVEEGRSTEQGRGGRETFVPSAVSVPLKPLFRCECGEKTLSYWQLASVVVNEGDEASSTNLCQKFFQQTLAGKLRAEEPLTKVKWRQVVQKKANRGRMWKMMGKEPYLRGM